MTDRLGSARASGAAEGGCVCWRKKKKRKIDNEVKDLRGKKHRFYFGFPKVFRHKHRCFDSVCLKVNEK